MVLKNKYKTIITGLLVSLLAVGCNGNGGTSSVIGGGNNNNLSSIDNNAILDQIEKDLTVEDGEPYFDEEVTLTVWSINGDPDKAIQEQLFKRFNDEYAGRINIQYNHIGHYDFYTSLETTWAIDKESIPDVLFMHNEKTIQYAAMEYIWPLNGFFGDDVTGVEFDFDLAYANIDRATKWGENRFAIPVDAHGFLTSIRQDIIKKNELGFDNNTRFIPESRAEYQSLLEGLRAKADAGELWIRDINKDADHTWKKANKDTFYPSFMQSTDPDGLSALYANGGSLLNEAQNEVRFDENEGFKAYLTDQVDRYNNRLMGDGVSLSMFGSGNTIMFSEGPWWISQQYDAQYNNADLTRVGKGVTAEDAADPVYSKPYAVSHPIDWWTLPENMESETAGKWYGNGHAISITRQCKSLKRIAAALEFAKWYTQGADTLDDSKNNLTTWCSSGHIPAWKNIYESEHYKAELAENLTLRALGDPANIIAMEGLVNESTVFSTFGATVGNVQTALKNSKPDAPVTHQDAINTLIESATGLEAVIGDSGEL